MSKEVGQKFAEALHRLEDDRDLEAIVAMYTENCEIGNVVVPEKYHGQCRREFSQHLGCGVGPAHWLRVLINLSEITLPACSPFFIDIQ